MEKRAQITIFVIIGIVIVLGIIVYVFSRSQTTLIEENNVRMSEKERVFFETIQSCFESKVQDSLETIGAQGGYYAEPITEYLSIGSYSVPFYYFFGDIYVPNRVLVEESLTQEIYFESLSCITDIDADDFDVSFHSVNVSVGDEEVTVLYDVVVYPEIRNTTSKIDFKNYPIIVSSHLSSMHFFAHQSAWNYFLNRGDLCISCSIETATNENLLFEMNQPFDEVFEVVISDPDENAYPSYYRFLLTDSFINTTNAYETIVFDDVATIDEINVTIPEDIE